jgi:hypothetical protein
VYIVAKRLALLHELVASAKRVGTNRAAVRAERKVEPTR